MKKIILLISMAVFAFALTACSASVTTSKADTNAAKPETKSPAPKDEKAKPALKSEKKPEGKAKAAKADNPIPDDWIYIYDDKKGYGFSVPDGSTGESDSSDGVDFMGITTPAPSEIDIFVLSYKDSELSKEDLLNDAVKFLEGLGQKVTPGSLRAESDTFALADATTVLEDGRKGKLRILVGTDITDNYVMIIGCDPDKFASNEKIIDEIWGSFEIWSGGGSSS